MPGKFGNLLNPLNLNHICATSQQGKARNIFFFGNSFIVGR